MSCCVRLRLLVRPRPLLLLLLLLLLRRRRRRRRRNELLLYRLGGGRICCGPGSNALLRGQKLRQEVAIVREAAHAGAAPGG